MIQVFKKYIYNFFNSLILYFSKEQNIIQNYIRVSDIMVPRKDIDAVDIKTDIETVKNIFYKTGHNVLLVYNESLDNLKGIIEISKILVSNNKWQSSVIEATCIPSSTDITDASYILLKGKMHILIVLDEYGGVDGIVTPVCILKKYDFNDSKNIIHLGNNKWLANGRLHITHFEEILGISLHSDEVITVGGYVCSLFGRVPKKYEKIEENNISFTVQESDDKCIYSIICTKTNDK